MSEQVDEIALACWDALVARYRERLGPQTVTEMMRASGMGRAEIAYGLQELAQDGWIQRVVVERDSRMVECWTSVEQEQQQRDQRRAEAQAAE